MTAGKLSRSSGFTLIELLVTLAVLAVLATVAMPSFHSLIASNKMVVEYNKVLSVLNYARSESVKQRKSGAVIFSSSSSGWMANVKVDADGDADYSDESAILTVRGVDTSVEVTSAVVQFNSLGRRAGCSLSPCRIAVGGGELGINIAGNISKVN